MPITRKIEKRYLPSPRQADVLQVFGKFHRGEAGEHTIPTLPDVARALGVRTASVRNKMAMLGTKGYVKYNGASQRVYELTEQGVLWCAEHRPKNAGGPTAEESSPAPAGLSAEGTCLPAVPPRTPQGGSRVS